jgi:hypothetical protein
MLMIPLVRITVTRNPSGEWSVTITLGRAQHGSGWLPDKGVRGWHAADRHHDCGMVPAEANLLRMPERPLPTQAPQVCPGLSW